MCPRGIVGFGVRNQSSGAPLLDFRSCGGEGLGESDGSLLEGCARMADRNGHELHFAPHFLEGVDKWGVLGGLLALPLVATEFSAEDDLAEEEVALLPVEGGRVRLGAVRDSPGIDEVGGCSMSRAEEAVLYFEGEDPFGDA